MIILTKRLTRIEANSIAIGTTLTLPYELRKKCRLRAVLDDGRDVALMLDRGVILQDGDILGSDCGLVVRTCAASEKISTVTTSDPLLLLRACYHLGNRHVQLQIEKYQDEHRLHYLRDHVLDKMLRHLSLEIEYETRPFKPESGAYHHG